MTTETKKAENRIRRILKTPLLEGWRLRRTTAIEQREHSNAPYVLQNGDKGTFGTLEKLEYQARARAVFGNTFDDKSDKPAPVFSKAATVAGLIVAFIVMFASTNLLARDRGEGITLQITEVDTQKIGEHKAAHIFHRSDVTAITGHIFQAKADGKVYILSSPKDMLQTGTYDARFVDKGRALIVREDFNGKRMNIRLAIDSVMDQAKPSPVSDVAAKLKDAMAPAKDAQADPSKFVISPTPSSHLGLCVEIMTYRDGSQECKRWADLPSK